MAEASARHNRIVCEQIEVAGGRVFKTVGEAFRAVFADPSAALASAVAIQRAAGTERWPPGLLIRVRMALHSGACVERDGDYFGPVVNRVARLLAVGHGGQVLVTGATYELLAGRLHGGIGLRDLGEHRLQDLGRAERVFQVTGPGLAGGSARCGRWTTRRCGTTCHRRRPVSWAGPPSWPSCGRWYRAGRGWSRSRGRAGSASPGWRCRWRPRRWMATVTGCGWSSWRRWPNPNWWPAPSPPYSRSARSRDGSSSTPWSTRSATGTCSWSWTTPSTCSARSPNWPTP